MSGIKKKVVAFVLTILSVSGMPLGVYAIDLGGGELNDAGISAGVETATTLPSFIGTIISIALSFLGALLLIYFVYAGILWMTSAGNKEGIAKAKDIMKNSVIGLIITLFSYSIVIFIGRLEPESAFIMSENTNAVGAASGFAMSRSGYLEENIGLIINIVLNLLGVVLLVLFIYAGILWMTAQGDDKQIGKAKDIMKNAVIGLILTLLAYSISSFVINQLSGQGTTRMDYGDSLIGGD